MFSLLLPSPIGRTTSHIRSVVGKQSRCLSYFFCGNIHNSHTFSKESLFCYIM